MVKGGVIFITKARIFMGDVIYWARLRQAFGYHSPLPPVSRKETDTVEPNRRWNKCIKEITR